MAKKVNQIFSEILEKIQPINFREKAKIESESQKLNEKHYLVPLIEEVKNVANADMYGLCKHLNFIYLYNGAYWEYISSEELADFLSSCAYKMGIGSIEAKYYGFKEKLVKQFLSSSGFKQTAKSNNICINLRNGTFIFDANSGYYLREPSKDDFFTYQLSFDYKADADAPIFQEFLNKVLPEIELQQILAEYLGYVFTKKEQLNLEKMLFCFGTGSNGKSVVFDIVTALLGKQNVSNYSLQNLTNDRGYQRAKIGDKLVNYASEISVRLEDSVFKLLSSGEPVEARLPYGEPFIMESYAKFIFNCNELPRGSEHTNAFYRRLLILPFRVEIKEKEKDTQLSRKIIENELPGIFNWILEGLKRLKENRAFTSSMIIEELQNEYKVMSDSVMLFIDEFGHIKDEHNFIKLKDLYERYNNYTTQSGLKPVSIIKFSERLKQKGFDIKRRSQGMIVFIR